MTRIGSTRRCTLLHRFHRLPSTSFRRHGDGEHEFQIQFEKQMEDLGDSVEGEAPPQRNRIKGFYCQYLNWALLKTHNRMFVRALYNIRN